MTTPEKLTRIFQSEVAMRRLQLGAAAVAIGLICWRLQFSTKSICCGDYDGYYHIMWSRMLWDGLRSHHFPPAFTWLPFTTWGPKNYVDHHFLFHLVLIPFTWFRDLRLGAKIAATLFASLALLSCFWFLLRFRIKYGLVWLVALLACSAPFLWRLNMAKAPPLALIYLVAGIYFLFRKKYWPLLPLAFAFTLTYHLFVLLILAAFIWVVVIGWTERRFEWKPILWVLLGTVAGFLITPYFPHNLHFFFEHLRMSFRITDYPVSLPNEWYAATTSELLFGSFVACAAMVIGYIAFDPADRKNSHHSLFFLIFSTALMVLTLRWQRMAEYWPPFAVMFAAFALQPWVAGTRSAFARLPADILDELQPFLDRNEPAAAASIERDQALLRIVAAAAVALALGIVLILNLRDTARKIAATDPQDHYQAGARWLRTNVPPGEIVFNTDWDDFPRLFYFDPTHRYVSGMHPGYLYDQNPTLSIINNRITSGEEEDPGPLIRDRFGARYVFTDNQNRNQAFYHAALDSGWFEIVYEDKDCTVLHIRDQRVEPPADEDETTPNDQSDRGNGNSMPE